MFFDIFIRQFHAENIKIKDLTPLTCFLIQALEEEMRTAAEELKFEEAARLRDEIVELREEFTSS